MARRAGPARVEGWDFHSTCATAEQKEGMAAFTEKRGSVSRDA
ncbi:hypothetical protein [Parafrankia discariae]|nr:hypothetical protein [Parafrankia discariae]